MKTNISDYIQVFEKLDELGCSYPEGIAILPVDFETATSTTSLMQLMEAIDIIKLFRSNDIPYSEIRRKSEEPSYIVNFASEWVGPTLFISALLLSENPAIISVALGVIANHLTNILDPSGEQSAKLDIVIEKNKSKTCKKINYEGPINGIPKLADIVNKLRDE